jgi:outer membrane protein OmpA-like peptidoglycan-associated protein
MKNILKIVFLLNSFLIIGQTNPIDWADYYYMNNKYSKAIKLYEKSIDSLNIDQERNLAFSYMRLDMESDASSTFRSIADNELAGVVDYLTFAQLLPLDSKLSKEYREKAKRIKAHQDDLLDNDSLIYKSRFYNSSFAELKSFPNNTPEDEFGAIIIPNLYDPSDHYNDKNQIEFYYVSSNKNPSENIKKYKRIISESTIYNIANGLIDTLNNKVIRDDLLTSKINSALQEGPVVYSDNLKKLFLTRSIERIDSDKKYQLNIYQVEYPLSENETSIEPIFELKDNYSNMHPTYDSENQWLYFSSDRPGGYGGMDLYRVRYNQNGVTGEPENLGIDINSSSDEVFPFIYNNDVLFYSSNQDLGLGKLDPFMATRLIENRWSTEPLGIPFSSEEDDFGFFLDSKTKLGFISSNRKGGNGKDDNYYFVSKPQVKGLEDRYMFESDTLVVSFDGVLKNDEFLMLSEDPLNSLVEKQVYLYQTPNSGSVNLRANGSFWYIPRGPAIKKDTFSYYLESSYSKTEAINVYLERVEPLTIPEIEFIFRPIYFEFDSADVWKKYLDRIDEVIAALNLYPNMEVKIKAFTDRRGNDQYNMKLSDRRSKSIVTYIKSKIENPNRVSGVGYGESLVKIKDLSIKVSDEEHQKERRVEFEINNF